VSDHPTLAIIIVSYNVCAELDACLQSIDERTEDCSIQIAVVDNGSTDGTLAMLGERWPGVEVIAAGTNVGFARANNLGIGRTSSDFVLLLNPDTILAPGAIGTLMATLAAHPEAAAVGPRLVDTGGRPELSFGWAISPLGELRQKLLMTAYERNIRPAARLIDRWTRRAGPREWLSAACLLLRRSDLEAVGQLDERYFMYYEDVDLCVALRGRGRTMLFVPETEVRHARGRSGASNPALARRRRESQLAYYRKHHPGWVSLLRAYLRLFHRDAYSSTDSRDSRD
jgi:N-acetylglucosaminyl-diphospho-decaprenol L-rhamnosyltransferase